MNKDPRSLDIADFDYTLPDSRIAVHPLECRDACKLLVRNHDGTLEDRHFYDLPDLLPADALLVANNTRVINARLRFRKPQGARIEIFCLEPHSPADYETSFASVSGCSWVCLVGNSKRWKSGGLTSEVRLPDTTVILSATRLGDPREDGASVIRFSWRTDDNQPVSFSRIIEAAGEIPIPPYLNRSTESSDSSDYQTVYSRIEGSVAAPTAGLHFTPALFEALGRRGVRMRELTLHVGAGTFAPVKSATIGDHPMHSEFISVPLSLIEELAETSSPVVAVGTTSVRTLESLYHLGCKAAAGEPVDELAQWYPYSPGHPSLSRHEALQALARYLRQKEMTHLVADTRIIIAPGYTFKVVDSIITNFHQPRSTLLLLVSAFTGGDWKEMYSHALASSYRFLSYGDAQLLL